MVNEPSVFKPLKFDCKIKCFSLSESLYVPAHSKNGGGALSYTHVHELLLAEKIVSRPKLLNRTKYIHETSQTAKSYQNDVS